MNSSDDTEPTDIQPTGERIAKVIARAGLASRREAEAWIAAGRVAVNGRTITSAALNIGPRDKVAVDGEPLPARERTRLWLYHKPRGLVTTARDPQGRTTVFDVLPPELPRVVSVGRLDLNTEGLLLLTNDGGLARVLAHPSTAWLRRYRVRAFGKVDVAKLQTLKDGIEIDGFQYGPIEAVLDRQQGDNAWLTLGLREGKNREVRRVLEHLGLSVNRLIRLSFGPFQLGDLGEGAAEEIRTRYLKDQLGSLAEKAECDFDAPMVDRTPDPVKQVLRARAGKTDVPRVRAGLTTDRKGRRVLVERFGEKPEPKPRKPRIPREERAAREDRFGGDRAPRGARAERAERPERPARGRGPVRSDIRSDASSSTRGDFRQERGPRPQRDGDAPRGFGSRAERGAGGGPRGKREREERPQEPRPYGNRARVFRAKPQREDRPREDRPDRGERRGPPRSEQSDRGERRDAPRARDDRPSRQSRGDGDGPRNFSKPGGRSAPRRPGGPRPSGLRPSGSPRDRSGERSGERSAGRPGGRPTGGKPGGRPGGGRPSGGRPSGGRPSGGRPGGGKPGKPRR
jgi:23S rRNA pseudouridine2605 synthase